VHPWTKRGQFAGKNDRIPGAPTRSICEVVSFIRICDGHIICGGKLVIEIPFGYKLRWIWVAFFIVMNGPPIEHHNRSFGDEMPFIPVVFSNSVIHPELVHRAPPK